MAMHIIRGTSETNHRFFSTLSVNGSDTKLNVITVLLEEKKLVNS